MRPIATALVTRVRVRAACKAMRPARIRFVRISASPGLARIICPEGCRRPTSQAGMTPKTTPINSASVAEKLKTRQSKTVYVWVASWGGATDVATRVVQFATNSPIAAPAAVRAVASVMSCCTSRAGLAPKAALISSSCRLSIVRDSSN